MEEKKKMKLPNVPKNITEKDLLNPYSPVRLALKKIKKFYEIKIKKIEKKGLFLDTKDEDLKIKYINEITRIDRLLNAKKEVVK